jgi:hypothetical protein
MEINKADITTTGIALVTGFITILAGSSLKEAGLLLSDKIKSRRLKNQIKIFLDAKKIAEENNIPIKQINLKTLVPLLEFSSLEEDETLQQKWSNLIVNFSNANGIYESSIYPFILNQLTPSEAIKLEEIKDVIEISSNKIKLTDIEISNVIRLGLLERIILEGFTFSDEPTDTKYYKPSSLGKSFLSCCSNIK